MRAALVDTSKYQGEVNPGLIAAAGFVGIVARCTIGYVGDNQPDPQYKRTQQLTRDLGLIFGAYHVLRPENRDPKREAAAFAAQAGPTDLDVLDCEVMGGQSPQGVVAQIRDCLLEMERLRGKRPIVYSGSWFWDGAGYIGPATPAGWEKDYALWEAEYTRSLPRGGVEPSWAPTLDPGDLSDGFVGWKFWQWTSAGRPYGVQSQSLDYDVFNGTKEQLRTYLGLDPPPVLPLEQQVGILNREAALRGWNLAP